MIKEINENIISTNEIKVTLEDKVVKIAAKIDDGNKNFEINRQRLQLEMDCVSIFY